MQIPVITKVITNELHMLDHYKLHNGFPSLFTVGGWLVYSLSPDVINKKLNGILVIRKCSASWHGTVEDFFRTNVV